MTPMQQIVSPPRSGNGHPRPNVGYEDRLRDLEQHVVWVQEALSRALGPDPHSSRVPLELRAEHVAGLWASWRAAHALIVKITACS
jgi:hypothetical protein